MKYYVIPKLSELDKYLELAKKYDLGFEYNEFFNPSILDSNDLDKTVEEYKKLNRKNDTLHGVFYDICLDSLDERIAQISFDRVKKSLDIASTLGCKGVIFHTNYITWMKSKAYQQRWINKNKEVYLKLIDEYPNLEIYVENMFDLDPYLLKELMDSINHERIGVCLDVAHASISKIDIKKWFEVLGKYIKHIHINDNDLIEDSHQQLGLGKINYKKVYSYINNLKDVTILIEISDYEKTVNSINYLKQNKWF